MNWYGEEARTGISWPNGPLRDNRHWLVPTSTISAWASRANSAAVASSKRCCAAASSAASAASRAASAAWISATVTGKAAIRCSKSDARLQIADAVLSAGDPLAANLDTKSCACHTRSASTSAASSSVSLAGSTSCASVSADHRENAIEPAHQPVFSRDAWRSLLPRRHRLRPPSGGSAIRNRSSSCWAACSAAIAWSAACRKPVSSASHRTVRRPSRRYRSDRAGQPQSAIGRAARPMPPTTARFPRAGCFAPRRFPRPSLRECSQG